MEGIPGEIDRHLRPAEQVLWWGRPQRFLLILPGRRLSPRPSVWMVWGAFAVNALVPDDWAPTVVSTILLASVFSAVGLIVTFLIFQVRQRRQICYVITRGRVLVVAGFLAGGTHAWSLAHLTDIRVQTHRDGTGTIWFGVVPPRALSGPSISAYGSSGDYVRPQFRRIKDAPAVCNLLAEARRRATTPPGS